MENVILNAERYIELNLTDCEKVQLDARDLKIIDRKPYARYCYLTAGKAQIEVDGRNYLAKRGTMVYLPAKSKTKILPDDEDPCTFIYFGFAGANTKEYIKACGFTKDILVYHDNAVALKEYFDALYSRYSAKEFLDIKCLGLAFIIISTIIDTIKPLDENLSRKERHISLAKDFIYNNYQFPISIVDIANSVGVTPNYLANIFDAVLGYSPKRFLTELRMERAKNLLKTGKYKMKDVGKLVGYDNQLHFSAEFKKNVGCSPLDYSRKMQEEK